MRRVVVSLLGLTLLAHLLLTRIAVPEALSLLYVSPSSVETPREPDNIAAAAIGTTTAIQGVFKSGETLSDIFSVNGLNQVELMAMEKAAREIADIGRISAGREYRIEVDQQNSVTAFSYSVSDDEVVRIGSKGDSYEAEKVPVVYEKRIGKVGGVIRDNLVSSIKSLPLALDVSDIFAWDIDFTTDLREGDIFRVVVEEFWSSGEFRKYGSVLAAEFVNNGQTYRAYRFAVNGEEDYFDDRGDSLRRAFLKAPLNYRRISSGFSNRRYHPVLKIYRPHLGVDYSANRGTPVSSIGDGTVRFAGYKGQNGNQVVIRHANGYETYYGHLDRISRGVSAGKKVRQGQIIGTVGTTGLSTGPHLDFRMKRDGKFINPLKLRLPSNVSIPKALAAGFESARSGYIVELASVDTPSVVAAASSR